jgi:predicted nucleic acid-binding protein
MFLVDANVFSELTKPRPEQKVLDWMADNEEHLFLSVITIAELQAGISRLADGRRKTFLQEWLDTLRGQFHESILAFDEMAAVTWGHLEADLIRKGNKIPARDSFLAAAARQHKLTIVTRNEKDFAKAGLKVLNPWK